MKLKVRYVGKYQVDVPNSCKIFMDVLPNKVYEVLSIENGFYRIVDESGEDYLYPPEKFVLAGKLKMKWRGDKLENGIYR